MAVPETLFPVLPTPPKVNVTVLTLEVSFRRVTVVPVVRILSDPQTGFAPGVVPVPKLRMPVAAPTGNTASSLTVGTWPKLQFVVVVTFPSVAPV